MTAVRTSFAFLFFLLGFVVKQEEAADHDLADRGDGPDNWFVWNGKQTSLLDEIPALWVPIGIDPGLRRQTSIARGLLPQRWFHREPRVAAR